MENLLELTRPLMQGYIFLFVVMLAAGYVVFWPYRTAKKMKEKREEEEFEELMQQKYNTAKGCWLRDAVARSDSVKDDTIFVEPKYNDSLRRPKWRQGSSLSDYNTMGEPKARPIKEAAYDASKTT